MEKDERGEDDLLEGARRLEEEAEQLEQRLEEAERHAASAHRRANEIDEPTVRELDAERDASGSPTAPFDPDEEKNTGREG